MEQYLSQLRNMVLFKAFSCCTAPKVAIKKKPEGYHCSLHSGGFVAAF
jgi:hypothetical protein